MKQKITTNLHLGKTFEDVYTSFIVSKTSLGISASTINNYKYHLRTIGRYLDITMPFDDLSKSDLEKMTVAMRARAVLRPIRRNAHRKRPTPFCAV